MPWIALQRTLIETEMQNNARIIWAWWQTMGGSMESCAALLANMEVESTINPALPEQGRGTFIDVITWSYGYGLIQWTPCSTYYSTFNSLGYDITDPDDQLRYLNYECQPGRGYWFKYPYVDYYYLTWPQFITSTAAIEDLTDCFAWSRERPGVPDMPRRYAAAHKWFAFLGGVEPARIPIWLLFKIRERNDIK